jgi:hypothetical protein
MQMKRLVMTIFFVSYQLSFAVDSKGLPRSDIDWKIKGVLI